MNVPANNKYLYFRKATAAGQELDDTTGSNMYPVSAIRGICAGTGSALGAITDDDDAFTIYLSPKATFNGSADADNNSGIDDHPDILVVAITTDNNQKAVIEALVNEINFGSNAMITLFDGGAGGAASKIHSDIEGITFTGALLAD